MKTEIMYSKTSHEIIRELNTIIAKAKSAADSVRKCKDEAGNQFWTVVADKTDYYADRLITALEQIKYAK